RSGDANRNGLLDATEPWVSTASGAVTPGAYSTVGTASARDATGTVAGLVTASDPDHYFGVQPNFPIVWPNIGKVDFLGSQLLAGGQGDLVGRTYYVNGLYHDVLGRTADGAGLDGWVRQLQAGGAPAPGGGAPWGGGGGPPGGGGGPCAAAFVAPPPPPPPAPPRAG